MPRAFNSGLKLQVGTLGRLGLELRVGNLALQSDTGSPVLPSMTRWRRRTRARLGGGLWRVLRGAGPASASREPEMADPTAGIIYCAVLGSSAE